VAGCNLCRAGGTAIQGLALVVETWTGCSVNGAVNPATTKKRRVGCIDDGGYGEGGYIRAYQTDGIVDVSGGGGKVG